MRPPLYTSYDAGPGSDEQSADSGTDLCVCVHLITWLALTSETYPSGRVVTTGYDGANRESSVTGQYVGVGTNYVTGTSYAPHGAPTSFTYGNNLVRNYTYDNRLRPSGLWDAVNNSPSNVLLQMGLTWGTNGTLSNVTTTHGGYGYTPATFNDYFWYDAVNRVTGANGKDVNNNLLWAQNFQYDPFGNAWMKSSGALPVSGNTPTSNVYNA